MQEHGIENKRHADITEHNLLAAIVAIKANHPDSGEVMVVGIYVQRQRIRDILRDIDTEGIQRRRTHAVQRVYSCQAHISSGMQMAIMNSLNGSLCFMEPSMGASA